MLESFPSPGDLPVSGVEPPSPALQANSLPSELSGKLNNLKKVGKEERENVGGGVIH